MAQGWQVSMLALRNVPAGQAVHIAAPGLEKYPNWHALHTAMDQVKPLD